MADSAASAFSRRCEYANSPGNRAYCYAELAISPEVECEQSYFVNAYQYIHHRQSHHITSETSKH